MVAETIYHPRNPLHLPGCNKNFSKIFDKMTDFSLMKFNKHKRGFTSPNLQKVFVKVFVKPLTDWYTIWIVEMGGLEPPSKHRTGWLSTRLSVLCFSTATCRKAGQMQLIGLGLATLSRVGVVQTVWNDTPFDRTEQSEKSVGILVAGAALAPEIKPFYLVD